MTTRKKDRVLATLRRIKGWAQVARDIAVILATIVTIVIQAINVVKGNIATNPPATDPAAVTQAAPGP